MRNLGALAALVVACSTPSEPPAGAPDASTAVPDAAVVDASVTDNDGDGLDDAYELELANAYLPFVSLDPADGCPLSGLLVRVRPHPADPTKISIFYDHLFQRDCGLNGHIGDNEGFGIAIDPTVPAPAGILAIKSASHQNTPCERITECSTCGDSRPACDLAPIGGTMWPVLYASKGKHGQYSRKSTCSTFGTCLDSCSLAATAKRPPIANAGEPGHPLVTDLTADGFITPANGWTEASLMAFDPWGAADFGGAGNVAGDLVDSTFVPAPCF